MNVFTFIVVLIAVFVLAFIVGYKYGKWEERRDLPEPARRTTVTTETDTTAACEHRWWHYIGEYKFCFVCGEKVW